MKLAGQVMRVYVPESVRRRALAELFQATAGAFGVCAPDLVGMSADQMLELFAAFTAEHSTAVLHNGIASPLISRRLYDAAHAIGAGLRHDLEITSTADAMAAARAVYRMLRIDFRGSAEGEVRVPRCFFSRFYSAQVCQLVSALDQGLLAGLTGGDRLEFRQRITEGAPCCLATLTEVTR